jgi:class 3 adenylate cyclase
MHVRVGLHCGAVTTGFVGGLTPRWSVYGAAVNTAARMEKHAGPSRVLCTGAFAVALAPLVRTGAFTTTLRQPPIVFKGIGDLESFWLGKPAEEGVAVEAEPECG